MMGRQRRDQGRLFYEFQLEDRIPENHLLRRMNVFVTAALADLHKELKPHYSDIGRPSIDPELMIRILIVGYCYGIRSERKLTQEVELHLAYRWFCKLDLEDKVPHHSTQRLAADTAYGTGKFLGWLVKEKRIAPHIPVWEHPKREDGKFSSSDFRWDGRRGVYICPNGKQLRTSGTVHSDGRQRYRARKSDCDACPLRAQCGTKNEPHHIARDVHEDARDVARRKMKTKAFLKSRDQRKRVEMRFAHLKTHHRFERL